MTVHVYFDDLNVGDAMPTWSRQTSFMEWNRYAAVNDEFVPFHMDDEAGRAAQNEHKVIENGGPPPWAHARGVPQIDARDQDGRLTTEVRTPGLYLL